MADREKVLDGLMCHSECEQGFDCDICGYQGSGDCSDRLAKDALDLIKEQLKLIDEITQRRANNGAFD